MAFATTTHWEIRTTGSDSNGGGFNVGSTGTDYSQQDSPQVTYTDLVIDGALNTKITSVANPFTSAHVGNIINITGGTGFTIQRVQINTVASGAATCDKAVGTVGSTGGTGNLGGACLTIATPLAIARSSNVIWIKYGNYSISSTLTSPVADLVYKGYETTHGDHGNRPTITSSTNSVDLFTRDGSSTRLIWENLILTHTAATRGKGINSSTGSSGICQIQNCSISGCSNAVTGAFGPLIVQNSKFFSCTGDGFVASANAGATGQFVFTDCKFYDNGGMGLNCGNSSTIFISRCLFHSNASHGLSASSSSHLYLIGSTTAMNGGRGIYWLAANYWQVSIISCIIYGNTTHGIYSDVDLTKSYVDRNAFGNNGTDAAGFNTGTNAVILSADPFTNSAGDDYTLNSTAGGGEACKDVGFSVENI